MNVLYCSSLSALNVSENLSGLLQLLSANPHQIIFFSWLGDFSGHASHVPGLTQVDYGVPRSSDQILFAKVPLLR